LATLYPTVRSFLVTLWKRISLEGFLLLVSAILALTTSGIFAPGMASPLKVLTAIFVWSLSGGDESDLTPQVAPAVVLLVVLTFCVRIVIAVVPRLVLWFISIQGVDDTVPDTVASAPSKTLASAMNLRARAKRLRGTGHLIFGTIILLVLLSFVMFQSADQGAVSMYYNFSSPLEARAQELTYEIKDLTRTQGEPGNAALLNQKREDLQKLDARLAEMSPPRSLPMYLLTVLSTKLAAILFVVFFVQLLGGIYRYLTRLAFFLDSRADVLELVGSTPDAATLVEILVPEKTVEMDQMPSFPVLDQLRDVLKTLGGKVP
jgi:hypothetical protein